MDIKTYVVLATGLAAYQGYDVPIKFWAWGIEYLSCWAEISTAFMQCLHYAGEGSPAQNSCQKDANHE